MQYYAWAATHRDTVTRLAIFDVPIPGAELWDTIYADPTVWHFAFHQNRDLPEFLISGREYGYVESFLRNRATNHGAFTDRDVVLYARAFAQPGAIRSTLEWYRAFERDAEDNRKFKQEPLTIPVLALGGENRWGPKIVDMVSRRVPGIQARSHCDRSVKDSYQRFQWLKFLSSARGAGLKSVPTV